MSPEAQRIAIAEVCGWTCIEHRDHSIKGPGKWLSGMNPKPDEIVAVVDGETLEVRKPTEMDYGWEDLPDYLNDLNAMHEAEKVLFAMDGFIQNEGHRTRYLDNLLKICRGGFHAGIHATAAQRAEAFLRSIGQWNNFQ